MRQKGSGDQSATQGTNHLFGAKRLFQLVGKLSVEAQDSSSVWVGGFFTSSATPTLTYKGKLIWENKMNKPHIMKAFL